MGTHAEIKIDEGPVEVRELERQLLLRHPLSIRRLLAFASRGIGSGLVESLRQFVLLGQSSRGLVVDMIS